MKKILIVEDNAAQSESLELVLSRRGWTVHRALDGLTAPQIAELHTPEAVILDLVMPGLPGREFLAWLRGRPETRDVPVVVSTGLPLDDVLDLEADPLVRVLRKPFTVDELLAALAEMEGG
jgi:two-component system, OmpR family, phosphate regulon response regulator PhoB